MNPSKWLGLVGGIAALVLSIVTSVANPDAANLSAVGASVTALMGLVVHTVSDLSAPATSSTPTKGA